MSDLLDIAYEKVARLAHDLTAAQEREAGLREALREARARLQKGRALWNGPCHECASVIDAALASEQQT